MQEHSTAGLVVHQSVFSADYLWPQLEQTAYRCFPKSVSYPVPSSVTIHMTNINDLVRLTSSMMMPNWTPLIVWWIAMICDILHMCIGQFFSYSFSFILYMSWVDAKMQESNRMTTLRLDWWSMSLLHKKCRRASTQPQVLSFHTCNDDHVSIRVLPMIGMIKNPFNSLSLSEQNHDEMRLSWSHLVSWGTNKRQPYRNLDIHNFE